MKQPSALSRTFHNKYANYQSDGYGRDLYITNENGGLCNKPQVPYLNSTFMRSPRKGPDFQPK